MPRRGCTLGYVPSSRVASTRLHSLPNTLKRSVGRMLPFEPSTLIGTIFFAVSIASSLTPPPPPSIPFLPTELRPNPRTEGALLGCHWS